MADHHDHSSSDHYVHGEMDIHQHQGTYELFGNMTKWGSLTIAVVLVFLVLLTCVPAAGGFMTALIVALVVAVLGWLLLKKKADPSH